jgi:phage shock protein PspC (stress-responsive transcriptional regulator)
MQTSQPKRPHRIPSSLFARLADTVRDRLLEIVQPPAAWRRPHSRRLRVVSGVCCAIHFGTGLNLTFLRITAALGLFMLPALTVPIYLGLWFLLPLESMPRSLCPAPEVVVLQTEAPPAALVACEPVSADGRSRIRA